MYKKLTGIHMTERFSQFYFQEKIDLFRSALNLFRKVKTKGIKIDKFPEVRELDRVSYQGLLRDLANRYTKKDKEKEKHYVEKLYNGEIDDKGKKLGDYESVDNISMYQTNKGGKIVLISLFTEGEGHKYFAAVNLKGGDYFVKFFGLTFPAFASKANLYTKTVNKARAKKGDYESSPMELLQTEPKLDWPPKIEAEPEDDEDELKDIKTETDQIGLVDISPDSVDIYVKYVKTKPRVNKLVITKPFSNNWGEGFEYTIRDGKNKYYILKSHDGDAGLFIFDSKQAKKDAIKYDLLDFFKAPGETWPKPIGQLPIHWKTASVENI